jgi:hypothetical protein
MGWALQGCDRTVSFFVVTDLMGKWESLENRNIESEMQFAIELTVTGRIIMYLPASRR